MTKLSPALGLSLLGALVLGAPRARADEPVPPVPAAPLAPSAPQPNLVPPPAPSPVHPHMKWYGWETMALGGAIILWPLALRGDPQVELLIGTILSPCSTMSIHLTHGDDVKAYVSGSVSYAMIAGGGALSAALVCGPHSRDGCTERWAFTGMILGGASAVVLDAVTLAWGGPHLPTPVKKAVLWPSVVPLPGGAAVSVGGTF
jgi:hypothetical protein